jgi:hypothetical protein
VESREQIGLPVLFQEPRIANKELARTENPHSEGTFLLPLYTATTYHRVYFNYLYFAL